MTQISPHIDESAKFDRPPLFGVPDGYESVFLSDLAKKSQKPILHIASDDTRFEDITEGLRFFAPDVAVLRFPAWNCLAYDRVSPSSEIVGERLKTLSQLLVWPEGRPLIVLTTVAAVTQYVPPKSLFHTGAFHIRKGGTLDLEQMHLYLAANGYHRTETVREAGEFAQRGGLFDLFPSGAENPIRIDCFGDEVEHIKTFDSASQRTMEEIEEISLYPVSEIMLNEESIRYFRTKYRDAFGAQRDADPLYESISNGRKYAGMEHWLPFFYDHLETIFDYTDFEKVTLDYQVEQARESRLQQATDLYEARISLLNAEQTASLYRPVPLDTLYMSESIWHKTLGAMDTLDLVPFAPAPDQKDAGARKGRDFGDVRGTPGADVYVAAKEFIQDKIEQGKKVLIACYSMGSKERLATIFKQHDFTNIVDVENISDLEKGRANIAVLGLAKGFETDDLILLTEQDILGDRLSRIAKKKKKSDSFIFEISQLHEGDYVVHQEHGVGQFEKLETVVVDQIPHDCLKIIYAGGDKLFVPVENLDVLSRYGSEEAGAVLDRLGGTAWQARKARVKRDLLAIANELLKIAAQRILNKAEPVEMHGQGYEKFVATFPYAETEDQAKAITDVLDDLDKDQAMDRLVCGDVGFGKTEVALRAAAVTALAGYQVAMIAPTTLLARQHYQNFSARFNGFPVTVGLLSRFVAGKAADRVREQTARGDINILIGTHALFSEKVKFNNLALLIVDEEQKFGVKQKEKLKELKENAHVLTLTATPIPRTLQMALSGVRELSLITTAPIDRLAIKTFVLPTDPVVIRDALMREHYRGGQSFYVCPRIADLKELETNLKALVPELKLIVAHGQMGADEIEQKISAFYEGGYDVLLSTNIVESGLDIPNANTMVIHRAEMFGLSQLYQLRGRIGRSKQRAYAYMTFPADKKLTKSAEQRLHAIEQLDTLGAGFQLASHDLDIRGAGNLLGEEQSGHIREIGVELYQQMLEEAVAAARSGEERVEATESWSPYINLGIPVVIPERYIKDMNLRLSIYRRIAGLSDRDEIESFAAEMIDRFGPLPKDVENLLDLVEIKQLCRIAGVDRVDAGEKGGLLSLHPSSKIDIGKLVTYIQGQVGTAKIRPEDQRIVFKRGWMDLPVRVRGVHKILKELCDLRV